MAFKMTGPWLKSALKHGIKNKATGELEFHTGDPIGAPGKQKHAHASTTDSTITTTQSTEDGPSDVELRLKREREAAKANAEN